MLQGMALLSTGPGRAYAQGSMPAVKTGNGPWGEAIRYWLPKRNMRNADLARATGIEEKTIGKMARGFHTTTRKLEVVAVALGVTLEEILVSPDRIRASENLERLIRDAVSAVLRESGSTQIQAGHDVVHAAVERQTRMLEEKRARDAKPKQKPNDKPKQKQKK